VIQHHSHSAVTHLRRKSVRRLARHRSSLSGVGASDKPGAVHKDLSGRVEKDIERILLVHCDSVPNRTQGVRALALIA